MCILTGSSSSCSRERELVRSLSRAIPLTAVEQALTSAGKREHRKRALPSALVVQVVIALGLLVDTASRQVLAYLLPRGASLPTKKSISRARYRIGPRPLMALFSALARPVATPDTVPSAFHRGLHLFSLDATKMDVPDTPENERVFGRPKASRGRSAFPQVKVVAWMESGTRLVTDLRVRPCRRHEHAAGLQLVDRQAGPGQLILGDIGYFSYAMMAKIRSRGAEFVLRAKSNAILAPLEIFPDGTYRAKVYPSWSARRRDRDGIEVRVIDYRVGDSGIIRLVTSLIDWKLDPAETLAALYHERWEIELVYDEVKTHQQGRPNGHETAIRARLPRGVVQEIYGLALAHRVVRTLMTAAAVREQIDPDRLSFKNALVIIRRHLPALAAARPTELSPLYPACSMKSPTNDCRRATHDVINAP